MSSSLRLLRYFCGLSVLLLAVARLSWAQTPVTPVAVVSPTPSPSPRSEAIHRSAEQTGNAGTSAASPRSEHRSSENGNASTTSPQGPTTAKADTARRSPSAAEQTSTAEASPQKFLQNLHRWQTLSPEEREALRRQQRINQEQREKSANEAYQKSGLHLNEEQRQLFRKHYFQERRKLEEQLAREIQEKRQAGNVVIVEQLKKEFSSPPVASSPSPASR